MEALDEERARATAWNKDRWTREVEQFVVYSRMVAIDWSAHKWTSCIQTAPHPEKSAWSVDCTNTRVAP